MNDIRMSWVTRSVAALLAAATLAACGATQSGAERPAGWTNGRQAPHAVYEAQGVGWNDRLYLLGGFDDALRASARSYAYDVRTNAWTRLADLPEPVTHAGQAAHANSIYVVGGFVGDHPGPPTDQVWRYDIPTDTWHPMPSLPAARGAGASAVLDGTLHFFGGTERPEGTYGSDAAEHWTLDLASEGTWQPAAPLPNPRNHLGGAAAAGRVYAVGGQHRGDEHEGNQSDLHAYDPTTDTWAAVTPLPLPLGHVAASTFEHRGRILVIGGVTEGQAKAANVLEYDPASDRWTNLPPLPSARQSPVAGPAGDGIVVATGSGSRPERNTWRSRP